MPAKLDNVDHELKQAIAARFKEIRISMTKKTQKDFALDAGRDKQSYSKNERGEGASIYTINKFCIECGISIKEFFDSELFRIAKPKKR